MSPVVTTNLELLAVAQQSLLRHFFATPEPAFTPLLDSFTLGSPRIKSSHRFIPTHQQQNGTHSRLLGHSRGKLHVLLLVKCVSDTMFMSQYAQYARLILASVGAEWEDKLYTCGPPPEFDRSQWLNDKPNLGLDFPNLPYLIDGDVRISQSMAIIRYLGRKYGLDGKTEKEKIRIDLAEQQLVDYRSGHPFYNPNFDTIKEDYKASLPDKLAALSKFLGTNEFFAGTNNSYVDFFAYEWLDLQRTFIPGVLDNYANLVAFMKRIEELPKIKDYMASSRYIAWPFNGGPAKWGGPFNAKP